MALEMRWFLEGAVPDDVREWIAGLSDDGHLKLAFPRQDVYLTIGGREDLGLKAREGRLEIKVRKGDGDQLEVLPGRISGTAEKWKKHKWKYSDSLSEVSTPFEEGGRLRVIKYRVQRKYRVTAGGYEAVNVDDKLDDPVLVVEVTELYSQFVEEKSNDDSVHRHWTLAIEAVGGDEKERIKRAGDLLSGYPGPDLEPEDSFGYPMFALRAAG